MTKLKIGRAYPSETPSDTSITFKCPCCGETITVKQSNSDTTDASDYDIIAQIQ